MTMAENQDRILPVARLLAALVIPFLVVAFIILYLLPHSTEQLFAWKLQPTMSAMMLGAAYAGGIYFFLRVLFAKQWHAVHVGFLPVATFASLLGIATVLHWDRFNHAHLSFFVWTALYFSTPFLVLGVWLRNRVQDPRLPGPGEYLMPRWAGGALGIAGVAILATGLLLFVQPMLMISLWPWSLTPLTSRVVGAMFVMAGMVGLGPAIDRRWSAAQIILEAQGVSIALILLATTRAWGEFDRTRPGTWLFVGGLAAMLSGILMLHLIADGKRRNEARAANPPELGWRR